MRTTRIVGGAAAVLVAAGALVALVDNRGQSDSARSVPTALSSADMGTADMVSGGNAESSFSGGATASAAGTVAAPDPAIPGRAAVTPAKAKVVKTATLSLSVERDAVTKIADAVSHIADRQGGYVANTQRESGDAQQATLTVRVPAAAYDASLMELRKLGKVTSESLGGKDVTGTLVDLDARLRSLRAQEQALNALMTRANTVGETLQVAQTAAEVRTQIEQLAAQQAQIADQADYATITVNVLGPHAAINQTTAKSDPLLVNSFKRAAGGTLAVFGGVIVVLGYALPTALLALVAFAIWRLANRRRLQTA